MAKSLTRRALRERLPSWGVLMLESHHASGFTMEWRTHPFVKVVYVLDGGGEFHFGRRSCGFSAGDVIVVPDRTHNRIVDHPHHASSLYVCCLSTELVTFDRRLLSRLKADRLPPDAHFSHRVAAIMRRLVHVQSQPGPTRPIAMVADALRLMQLVVDRTRKRKTRRGETESPQRSAVADYAERLGANFFEATTIDEAAASLGMPRRTFTRLFAEVTGETWLRYVRRLAIRHAQQRLKTTDLPIVSVAFECGFNDLSTFYRQFKSRCGMSPARYRQTSR